MKQTLFGVILILCATFLTNCATLTGNNDKFSEGDCIRPKVEVTPAENLEFFKEAYFLVDAVGANYYYLHLRSTNPWTDVELFMTPPQPLEKEVTEQQANQITCPSDK